MLLPGQTRFGPRRTAIQRRLRRFHNRRIVRALAFYQGWWGVRPKSRVTSQPPRLVDLLYREDPHILCFREACQQPSLPSLFGMPYGHSLSCLLIRRYRMSAVTFCLLLCVPRYQLAQTPVSPHGAAGQHKQTPSLLPLVLSSSSSLSPAPKRVVIRYAFIDCPAITRDRYRCA